MSVLIDALKIPSFLKKDDSSHPFGSDIQKALEHAVSTLKSLGFITYIDPEGYYAYGEVGEGSEMVGILGHIDVVPPGDISNWKTPPFEPTVIQDKLYARGSQDDKGPLYASIFASKCVMDKNIPFKRRLRIIVGADEESYFRCMKKYNEKEEIPTMGFTPDASFPLINAEKGFLQVRITHSTNVEGFTIHGGNAPNVVADRVVYRGKQTLELSHELKRLNYEFNNDGDSLTVIGKSAHVKDTHKGINAISRLCIALHNIGVKHPLITFIAEKVKETFYGELLFGTVQDDDGQRLHLNVGTIKMDENNTEIMMDMRAPVKTADIKKLKIQLTDIIKKYELQLEVDDMWDSLYVPIEHPLIQTLLSSYQELTNDFENKPITSGGMTYARALKNCVAFGPIFPNSPSSEHQPNENISLPHLYRAMEIYINAIEKLIQ